MTVFEAITLFLAAYGAGLSSLQAWMRFNDNRNKLHVKVSNGMLVYGSGTSDLQLFLQAVNKGKMPVHLAACGLSIDGMDENIIIPHPDGERALPCILEPQDSVQFWLNMAVLKTELKQAIIGKQSVKIRGTFTTKAGLKVRSKPWTINLFEK